MDLQRRLDLHKEHEEKIVRLRSLNISITDTRRLVAEKERDTVIAFALVLLVVNAYLQARNNDLEDCSDHKISAPPNAEDHNDTSNDEQRETSNNLGESNDNNASAQQIVQGNTGNLEDGQHDPSNTTAIREFSETEHEDDAETISSGAQEVKRKRRRRKRGGIGRNNVAGGPVGPDDDGGRRDGTRD